MIYSRPAYLPGGTKKIKLQDLTAYITINCDHLGPIELICKVGKAGDDIHASSEALGKMVSRALQRATTKEARKEALESLKHDLRSIQGTSFGWDDSVPILSVPDAMAYCLLGCPDKNGPRMPEMRAPKETKIDE